MKKYLLLLMALAGCAVAYAEVSALRVNALQFTNTVGDPTTCTSGATCFYQDSFNNVLYTTNYGTSVGYNVGSVQAVGSSSYSNIASQTIATAAATLHRIPLGATATTSVTLNTAGVTAGRIITVKVSQDSTGSRTIASTWTNATFAGGSYTATATANKSDTITFVYDLISGKWIEIGRALNQ